jgi:hypothetical protein
MNTEHDASASPPEGVDLGKLYAWTTARDLLASTSKPLPPDVLALALFLSGALDDDAPANATAGESDAEDDEPDEVEAEATAEDDFAPVSLMDMWAPVRVLLRRWLT